MVSLKRTHFSVYHCVTFPAVVRILVGRLDSCFLTHTKKYMTPIHALIFEKHVKMCVYIRQIKKPVYKLIMLWRSTCSKKSWLGGHVFQNSGSQGPGRVSTGRTSRAAPSTHFFMLFSGLMGFNCVVKVPHKSQCNNYGLW